MKKVLLLVLAFAVLSCNDDTPNVPSYSAAIQEAQDAAYEATYVAAMNAADYLGHSNWQLPTTPIRDTNCAKTGPNGASFGFGCTAGALFKVLFGGQCRYFFRNCRRNKLVKGDMIFLRHLSGNFM